MKNNFENYKKAIANMVKSSGKKSTMQFIELDYEKGKITEKQYYSSLEYIESLKEKDLLENLEDLMEDLDIQPLKNEENIKMENSDKNEEQETTEEKMQKAEEERRAFVNSLDIKSTNYYKGKPGVNAPERKEIKYTPIIKGKMEYKEEK